MPNKVVILGGGVAGLSAAHELVERGYEVEVLEKLTLAGGKARSIPVLEGIGDHGSKDAHADAVRAAATADPLGRRRPWLPGEHGFRFFPNFYRHITDTLARIPTGSGTVGVWLVIRATGAVPCTRHGERARARRPPSPVRRRGW